MSIASPWWGEVVLDTGQVGHWQLGPLLLWVKRRTHEWRIATRRDPTLPEGPAVKEVPFAGIPESDAVEVNRYGAERTSPQVHVGPVLAPRPVVCRPEVPFVLLPGSRITAYVSTPLWVRVQAPGGLLIHDIDVHRPSGSWFGPNTREGELCFASRTRLRLDAQDIQHSPTRAITPVHLANDDALPLTVSQINLPVPHLDLVAAPDGTLWTQPVRLGSQQGGLVAVDIEDLPANRRVAVLAPARIERPERRLISALAHVLR